MKRFIFLVVLLGFGFNFATSPQILAQSSNTEGNSSTSPFDMNLSNSFGGLFFQDQIGLQIARQGITSEGFINKDTYTLGNNDLISIDIKGSQPIQMRGVVVNPQGEIVIPVVGMINVRDKTIAEAQIEIQKQISEVFNNPEVIISLDKPRALTVHINGDIPHPGKYVVPAQSRVDLAIYQALTDGDRTISQNTVYSASDLLRLNFSFRNILITQPDGNIKRADLITYYSTGKLNKNPFINDGDLITIFQKSKRTERISLSGAVRAPFEIEFLPSDTPSSLLELAGGFTIQADSTELLLVRFEDNQLKKITLDKSQWETFKLQPNDRLIAETDSRINSSASAWITGEVSLSGNFPILDGVTSAYELLDMAGNFTNQALPHAAYMLRAGSVENEVPNKFNVEVMKRTSDQILQGFEYLELESRLSRNQVHIDLTDTSQLKQVLLFDGDRLFVPRDENTVFIFGQVNNPGYFPFIPELSNVNEYIRQAGGLSLAANKDRIYVIKAGSKTWYRPNQTDLMSGDMIFVDRNPFDELNAQRTYDIQKEQLKNTRIQLIMTGLTTITSIVTTLVAIDVIKR